MPGRCGWRGARLARRCLKPPCASGAAIGAAAGVGGARVSNAATAFGGMNLTGLRCAIGEDYFCFEMRLRKSRTPSAAAAPPAAVAGQAQQPLCPRRLPHPPPPLAPITVLTTAPPPLPPRPSPRRWQPRSYTLRQPLRAPLHPLPPRPAPWRYARRDCDNGLQRAWRQRGWRRTIRCGRHCRRRKRQRCEPWRRRLWRVAVEGGGGICRRGRRRGRTRDGAGDALQDAIDEVLSTAASSGAPREGTEGAGAEVI